MATHPRRCAVETARNWDFGLWKIAGGAAEGRARRGCGTVGVETVRRRFSKLFFVKQFSRISKGARPKFTIGRRTTIHGGMIKVYLYKGANKTFTTYLIGRWCLSIYNPSRMSTSPSSLSYSFFFFNTKLSTFRICTSLDLTFRRHSVIYLSMNRLTKVYLSVLYILFENAS
jgi:hypothetical protein